MSNTQTGTTEITTPFVGNKDIVELRAAVYRQTLHREILFKLLGFCQEERTLAEIDKEVESYPEFCQATQSQYFMAHVLARHGGLEVIKYDADGKQVTESDLAELSEDEAADLVDTLCYKTTEVGNELVEEMSVKNRIEKLFEDEPERKATYQEILKYCAEDNHPYTDIQALLSGRDIMRVAQDETRYFDIQASVFVDKLERAGVLNWLSADAAGSDKYPRGYWFTNDEGKKYASA